MIMSYGNIIMIVRCKTQLVDSTGRFNWRNNIVITEANCNSRENNRGGHLGCLKCSYGPANPNSTD